MANIISIAEISRSDGQNVTLRGWLSGMRSSGKIIFLQMRDGTGVCQCLVDVSAPDAFQKAGELTQESSFSAVGLVRRDERAPGGFELVVSAISLIHRAEEYPIARKAHGVDFLMNHRHLWLRSARQRNIMRIRHTLVRSIRRFFDERGFTLIDTPILIQNAAEGAGTLFPVDYFGERAYLSQTGQLYLECAAMALGKVYCFGPTFRAEKSKTRRHLTEFWMVEPEMAFAGLDEVMRLAEELITFIVAEILAAHEPELRQLDRDPDKLQSIKPPFARLTYTQAVELLRSPDVEAELRKELEADRGRLRQLIEELEQLESRKTTVRKGWQQDQMENRILTLRENIKDIEQDLAAGPDHIEQAHAFRWGNDLGGSDETILARRFNRPLFITEYPTEAKAFYMKRSPSDPRVVLNFDLLAPEGYGEIIGGSQREDDLDALLERMRSVKLDPDAYRWYLDLRRYGTVPHGGFGLGVERTLAWVCGLKHVRETIPFPRLLGRMAP